MVTIVTDDGGPFRSLNFELFITSHPELRHIRTRVRTPRQSGSPERGFATLKYERLFPGDIPDALTLVERAGDYRIEYNTARPHEAIARNRPLRNLPRARRPRHPHLRTRRSPANYLTRDTPSRAGAKSSTNSPSDTRNDSPKPTKPNRLHRQLDVDTGNSCRGHDPQLD